MKLVDWILGLFKKPKEEITFEKAELSVEPWPFPAPKKKRGRPALKKATTKTATKKPAAKKTVKKKAK
jgi:hypothetical protein